MSHSLYPVTREPSPPYRESGLTKVLAILLLVVAGALVFTVYKQKQQTPLPATNFEPRPIAQRPDDKLGADEQATIDVFEKFNRSVVHVTSIASMKNRFTMDPTDIDQATGTGFVWDQQGHIVTNFHVVQGASKARVTLDDGDSYPATIIGVAPDKDIAVLLVDAAPAKLLPLPVGQSANLKVGQKVLAIGNPFGFDHTLTTGVISGLGREMKGVSGRPISDMIQTDASINPGNSGGPLLDSAGRLIGINTMIYSMSGSSAGIGFAVPVDTVNMIVPELLLHGKIMRPGLGINILSDQITAQAKIDGIGVYQVAPGSAADRAGLKGVEVLQKALGDVIVAFDGKEVHKSTDLYRALDTHKVGDQVELTVQNNGTRRTVKVTLQEVQ